VTSFRAKIRRRLQTRLQADGVDAYLAYTRSNNHYCSGYWSWLVGHDPRFSLAQLTLVPADAEQPVGLLVPDLEIPSARAVTELDDVRGYSTWIETRELPELTSAGRGDVSRRGAWLDVSEQERLVRNLLGDRQLLNGTIATDLQLLTVGDAELLNAAAPDVHWLDYTERMFELRAVKHEFEIDLLRRCLELQESAFRTVSEVLGEGMAVTAVRYAYERAVIEAAGSDDRYADFESSWLLASVGPTPSAGGERASTRIQRGQLIALDGGVRLGGYGSDGARTFAMGEPSSSQARRLFDVLRVAGERACEALTPGRPLSDAFHAAERYVHANGFPHYVRGQYGHSVGLEVFPAEPPFISREESRAADAGMVLAVEVPYYAGDVGPIAVEDLVLVTDDGPLRLNTLPRELVVL
jgi:Xaa-Pro aminopeptidase